MLNLVSRLWKFLALRGILGLIFAAAAFLMPQVTFASLILVFGVYAFADGICAIALGVRDYGEGQRWWTLLLEGLLGVAVVMVPGPVAALLLPISLIGIGIGVCWAFILQRVMTSAKHGEENIAAASVATVQQTGIAFGAAIAESIGMNSLMARQVAFVVVELFRGNISLKQLEGPLGIARESGRAARQGASELLKLMAMIGVNLAILNLLPIPPLDGGHILLLFIEGTIRRDLSMRVKERFVTVSMVFLLLVFAIVMYNDVLRLAHH